MIDRQVQESIEGCFNLSVPFYLMASYAYYVEDAPFLSDHYYDKLAREMHDRWDEIEHMHKHHLSKDDLRAGTFLGEYPTRVKGAVAHIRTQYAGIGVYQ